MSLSLIDLVREIKFHSLFFFFLESISLIVKFELNKNYFIEIK